MTESTSSTVSVVTAAYNYANYLPEMIESVERQTYSNWELIIVDDGSTDATPAVVAAYLSDPRIRYYRTENEGQPTALNIGVSKAQGPFIAFLDADDSWLPRKLELQLAKFRDRPETGVVYCGRTFVNADGLPVQRSSLPMERGIILEKIFLNNFICFSSSVVRREVFASVGTFDPQMKRGNDFELWLRAASKFAFDYVSEPLVRYRVGHTSLSTRGDSMLIGALTAMDRFLNQYGGRQLLSRSLVRRAYAETFAHLAGVVAQRSPVASFGYFLRAASYQPFSLELWRTLAQTILPESVRNKLRQLLIRSNKIPSEAAEAVVVKSK